MRHQGRYLRFRHVFPELFSPAMQARRGLLRFRWFLLQRIDFRPIWTIGAAAGLGGVLLTVSLFFLNGLMRPVVAAREVARIEPLPEVPLPIVPLLPATPPTQYQPEPLPLAPVFTPPVTNPLPTLTPYLSPEFTRLVMPFGWEDRRLTTIRSIPESMEQASQFAPLRQDGWVRSLFRSYPASIPQAFAPYREPSGLRWNSVTPEVRVSNVAPRGAGVLAQARPMAVIEKQMPGTFTGARPLEYRLIVTNPSPQPLPDVSVFEAIDVGRVMAVQPPARIEPNGLSWRLNGLAPGERRELLITLWTEGLTALTTTTDVELADRVAAVVTVDGQTEPPFFQPDPPPVQPPAPAPTPAPPPLPAFPQPIELPPFPTLDERPAPAPAPLPPPAAAPPPVQPAPVQPVPAQPPARPILQLHADPPTAVAVGEDATTWYEIANIGDAPATDIVLRLKLAEGLLHHDGSLDVEYTLPRLEPGEKQRALLVTRVRTQGVHPVNGQLTSGDILEISSFDLFAPATETSIGDSSPREDVDTDDRRRSCQCTLLVRQTSDRR